MPATIATTMAAVVAVALAMLAGAATGTLCRLRLPGTDHAAFSATSGELTFWINFNATLQQANVVAYIGTSGKGKCNGCLPNESCKGSTFDSVPYSELINSDYTESEYSRGHLVPRADYGCTTMIISNAVPMTVAFNGGTWAKTENELRLHHAGALIVKGCEYAMDYFKVSQNSHRLYIPLGCYYTVFAESSLSAYGVNRGMTLVDYEYCTHNSVGQPSRCSRALPYWLDCGAGTPEVPNEGLTPAEDAVIGLAVLLVLILLAGAAYIRQRCLRARAHSNKGHGGVELSESTGGASELGKPLMGSDPVFEMDADDAPEST